MKDRACGIWIKLDIYGKTSQPFSATTLPPFCNFKPQGYREKIVMASRAKYAGRRKEIERIIEKQSC